MDWPKWNFNSFVRRSLAFHLELFLGLFESTFSSSISTSVVNRVQWIYPPDNFTITECKKILLQMPLLYVFWSQNGWKGHSTLSNSYSSNRTPEFSTPFLIFISLAWFVFVICNLPLKHSVPHSRSQSFDPFDQRRGSIPDAGQKDRSSGNKNESSQGFSSAHS